MTSLLILTLALVGCGGGGGGGGAGLAGGAEFDSGGGEVWGELALGLIRQTPGFSPPVASRALGYMGVTFYETVRPGMPGYASLGGALSDLPPIPATAMEDSAPHHWSAAANAAMSDIVRALFPNASPTNMAAIDQLESSLAASYAAEESAEVLERSVNRGRAIAEAIRVWSLTDGGAFGYLTNGSPGYVPPVGPGFWEPTPPAFAPALQANWGANRTMCLPSGSSCSPGSSFPTYSTDPASAFYAEALDVRNVGMNLTAEQTEIALFWADGGGTYTPPGHWISILNQITTQNGYDLARSAEAYSKVGIAACDAFISCWNAKYAYSLMRPITYIQNNIDPMWTPLITTPPFPEFTSGHSTQSGAIAVILTDLYGDNFAFTDMAPGFAPRNFTSFFHAAQEAAISRLYGGIHYQAGIDIGVTQGKAIGQAVAALPYRARGAPTGQVAANQSGDVAHAWFDFSRELIRTTPGFSPPVASRALGYMGVALYESVVHGMPGRQSLAMRLNDLTPLPRPLAGAEYHWPSAANAALADVCRALWPTTSGANMMLLDALEAQQAAGFAAAAAPEVLARSVNYGKSIAESVTFWALSDGGHRGYATNFPTNYAPPVGPGLWVPTGPGFQSALQPYWGNNRTMALADGAAADPGAPPPYSTDPSSTFYAEAEATRLAVANLTQEQADIAVWWGDGGGTSTPPGHSISMATIALRSTQARLDRAAWTYAQVGIGVCDAFISCWNSKYRYNLLRPETYIQQVIQPGWMPLLSTPPFPEYTSGHSVQSGAAGHILTAIFGGGFAFVDDTNSTLYPTIGTRTFSSFMDAANEAALSRLYGGIHYPAAIFTGVQQGVEVGKRVVGLFPNNP